jgi:hypothetical protein
VAYRFELREEIGSAFVRIANEQIDRAERDLSVAGDRDVGVHEGRKSLKRLRALLRLVRPGIGNAAFRGLNDRLRDIAALYSADRDRHVLRGITQACASELGTRYRKAFAGVLRSLADRPGEIASAEAAQTDALARLAEARKVLARLRVKPNRFESIAAGLEANYRRGRRRLQHAYIEPSDEAFHDLRKAVQLHWRHMQVLQRAWPDLFTTRLAAARNLSQMIGDDHDLAVFIAYLKALPRGVVAVADRRAIEQHCRQRQLQLRTKAHPLCRQLYAEGAKRFARRIAVIWQEAERADEIATQQKKPPQSRSRGKRKARRGNSAQRAPVQA